MTYQVLARRLRPKRFEEVVGQEHVTRTLQAAIAAGRVAHAFLFAGPRGGGKTTTARLPAKALNCERGGGQGPGNECPNRRRVGEGRAFRALEIARAEGVGLSDDALALIAREAEGSLRDAQSLLDQVLAAGEAAADEATVREILGAADRRLVIAVAEHVLGGDAAACVRDLASLH